MGRNPVGEAARPQEGGADPGSDVATTGRRAWGVVDELLTPTPNAPRPTPHSHLPRPSPAQGVRPELLSPLVDHARELPVALALAFGLGRLEQRRLRGGLQPDQL